MVHKSENAEYRESQEEFLRPPTETKKSRWGFRGMTVRDWLPIVGALLIPVVIALGTWGITWQQGRIEDRRAKAERKLAAQRAQDEALQAYLDQMGNLLLEKNLRSSEEDSEVRTLARARTLTVLGRLDTSHKTAVMQFLVEAQLVQTAKGRDHPIIGLGQGTLAYNSGEARGADLNGVDLGNTYLRGADFYGVELKDADLHGTDMRDVYGVWVPKTRRT